jgi:hypothetical protein
MTRHVLVLALAASAEAGAALFFARDAGGLSKAEQAQIFAALELAPSADGKELLESVCQQPVSWEVAFSDWNGDGAKEVRVAYGNSCLAGHAGSIALLFTKDAKGRYAAHRFGPGVLPEPLASKSQGFPDLRVGGPGFCHPVWRWNGKTYQPFRNDPETPGACDGAQAPR